MLNNLYDNVGNAPSLQNFIIKSISKCIDKKFYLKFIKKILKLKLKVIYIQIVEKEYSDSTYSLDEIGEILNGNIDLITFENKVVNYNINN